MKKQIMLVGLLTTLSLALLSQKKDKGPCLGSKNINLDEQFNAQVAKSILGFDERYQGYHSVSMYWEEISNYEGYLMERVAEVSYAIKKDSLCTIKDGFIVQKRMGSNWTSPEFYEMFHSKVPTSGKTYFDAGSNWFPKYRSCSCIESSRNWLKGNGESSGGGGGNGLKDGPFVKRFKNGNTELEGNIKNGKPVGIWKEYYESGGIKTEVNLIDGLEEGTAIGYEEGTGKINGKTEYKNGKKNGKDQTIENNVVTSIANYVEDKLEGEKNYYDKEGDKTKTETYKADKLNGPYKEWSKGKLKMEGAYLEGVKDGAWKTYDNAGKMTSQVNWKDGVKE